MRFRLVVASVVVLAAVILSVSHTSAQGLCFKAAVSYTTGGVHAPRSVIAADLDGDGDRDLALANNTPGGPVSVLMNHGNGTYAPAVNYANGVNGVHHLSVFAVDLDADGDQDLAAAFQGVVSGVSVLKNNGDGTFAAAINYTAGTQPTSVFATDLDGDGNQDLAVANYGSGNISVLKNNGDGTFATAVNYAAGGGPTSVFAADLDGDGRADLAVANYGYPNSGSVSVLKGNGDGTFAPASYVFGPGPGEGPISVFAADLDGDIDVDLAVANVDSSLVSVMKNNGDGTFAAAVNYAAGSSPLSVFAADLDGDGDQDLAVTNSYGITVSILKNNGDGTFAAAISYTAGTQPTSVFAADLDGDLDQDLAVANDHEFGTVSILLNCGPCSCPHQGDIATRATGDGFIDVFDVIEVIGIAFEGTPDIQDPNCPTTRGDVDNNSVTDVFDVIYLIATAFGGGANPIDPCAP